MIELILGAPCYGPTEPEANRHLRVAIMHAARHGCVWLGDATPNRMSFDAARSAIATQVTNDESIPDSAFIAWVDSDVVLPPEAFTQLAHRAVERNFEFITGIYVQRDGDHWPLIAHRVKDKGFQWCAIWPENAVFPVDGCGFGVVLTGVGLMRRIGKEWFQYKKYSEDFDFCIRAKEHGAQLWVDSSIICGHLMEPLPATLETFKAKHPDLFDQIETQKRLMALKGDTDNARESE